MLIVQDKLVSDDVARRHFICNLNACKGACCWEGDYGAPLEADELPILEAIYPAIKSFLSPLGIEAIEKLGTAVYEAEEKEWATPLVDLGPCAYMTFDAHGVAQCGIEQAWKAGATEFRKPVSCHLYPIRVDKNEVAGFEALNYHEWHICNPACALGDQEQLPVYVFLKEAIIRKYGADFYEELDAAAQFVRQEPED